MEASSVASSVAYCGLICHLCFLASKWDGCRTAGNRCDRNCSDEGCFQKACCEFQHFEGCWQCEGLPECESGIYSLGDTSKIKAFALCIQQDGLDAFITHVLRNQEEGLSVEKGRDYDGKPVTTVLNMLRTGKA